MSLTLTTTTTTTTTTTNQPKETTMNPNAPHYITSGKVPAEHLGDVLTDGATVRVLLDGCHDGIATNLHGWEASQDENVGRWTGWGTLWQFDGSEWVVVSHDTLGTIDADTDTVRCMEFGNQYAGETR